jgi:hypothetical protein
MRSVPIFLAYDSSEIRASCFGERVVLPHILDHNKAAKFRWRAQASIPVLAKANKPSTSLLRVLVLATPHVLAVQEYHQSNKTFWTADLS